LVKFRSFRFTLPLVTPSGNQTRQWDRSRNWKRIKSEKEGFLWELKINELDRIEFKCTFQKKRRVEFRSFRKRLLDDDNLIQGFKMLRDALEEMGIIWKDSPEYLDAEYYQEIDRDNPRTEIVVRDV